MRGKWWLGFGDLVSIICGVLLFIVPITGARVMTLWFRAYALVFGIAMLVLSFRLKSRRDEPAGAMRQRA